MEVAMGLGEKSIDQTAMQTNVNDSCSECHEGERDDGDAFETPWSGLWPD